jgi:hypothetical protein
MRWVRTGFVALAMICAATAAGADERLGIGVKAGTLGFGLDFTVRATNWLAFRVTGGQYDYARSFDNSGITYDGTLKVGGYGALADFYPSKSKFRLTVGALSNRNKIDLTSTPTSNIDIGDNNYTPAQVGTLTGDLKFKSVVPYFGIGYGNAARGPHRVGFVLDVGVETQGSPVASLAASGGGVSQADLDKETQQIEDDTSGYKIWPVIAFGISFRIW